MVWGTSNRLQHYVGMVTSALIVGDEEVDGQYTKCHAEMAAAPSVKATFQHNSLVLK